MYYQKRKHQVAKIDTNHVSTTFFVYFLRTLKDPSTNTDITSSLQDNTDRH